MITKEETEDGLLLEQLRNGCSNAFQALYSRYWQFAYLAAYKRLNDSEQAKDIVQEIFVQIWLRRECEIRNFPGYLNIAVRNRVFKHAARNQHQTVFLDKVAEIADFDGQPDSDIRYRECHKAYEALLASLPKKRQIIFRMRFDDELDTAQIAERMGISRKTVQNQLGRAIEFMKVVLLPSVLPAVCFLWPF